VESHCPVKNQLSNKI